MIYAALFKGFFGSLDWIRMKVEKTPQNVSTSENIYYSDTLQYDIYQCEAERNNPVIINVHGGGWVYGSRAVYRNYCMQLASYGYTVINYDYRLAPDHHYPAPLEDLNQLLLELKHKGIINDSVYGIGDSAGAQILAQYAVMLTNQDYAENFDFTLADIQFKALALNCGIFDPVERVITKPSLTHWYLSKLLTAYAQDYLSLRDVFHFEKYITADFPPIYIANSVHDPLVGRQPEIVFQLKKVRISSVYQEYGHRKLWAMHNFQLSLNELSRRCMEDELTFFQHHQ